MALFKKGKKGGKKIPSKEVAAENTPSRMEDTIVNQTPTITEVNDDDQEIVVIQLDSYSSRRSTK